MSSYVLNHRQKWVFEFKIVGRNIQNLYTDDIILLAGCEKDLRSTHRNFRNSCISFRNKPKRSYLDWFETLTANLKTVLINGL